MGRASHNNRQLRPRAAFPRVDAGRCRVCGADVPPGRRTTCGRACAERLRVVCFANTQRLLVHRRDRGVCALCGRDCDRLRRILYARHRRRNGQFATFILSRAERAAVLMELGYPAAAVNRRNLWDMDHIRPVCRGGGVTIESTAEEVLGNLRTLCVPCHRAETARLVGELADERRPEGRRTGGPRP